MKLAIPMAEEKLAQHFGHCEKFAIVEVDDESRKLDMDNITYLTPPPHEPGLLPRWLAEKGADIIIAGGMGKRAQDLFIQNGIRVVVGAQVDSAPEIARKFLDDSLQTGNNLCDH